MDKINRYIRDKLFVEDFKNGMMINDIIVKYKSKYLSAERVRQILKFHLGAKKFKKYLTISRKDGFRNSQKSLDNLLEKAINLAKELGRIPTQTEIRTISDIYYYFQPIIRPILIKMGYRSIRSVKEDEALKFGVKFRKMSGRMPSAYELQTIYKIGYQYRYKSIKKYHKAIERAIK